MANTVTRRELLGLVKMLKFILAVMAWLQNAIGAILAALEELDQMRQVMKMRIKPVNFDEFVKVIETKDDKLAHLLRRCEVQEFTLGRLWLTTRDAFVQTFLGMNRDRLSDALSELYKAKFKVRIIEVE
jgi:hypothetical protein